MGRIAKGGLMRVVSASGALWLAGAGCGGSDSSPAACDTAVVRTTSGDVCGSLLNLPPGPSTPDGAEVMAYRGIPYAEPPVGALRFMPPVPKSSTAALIDATAFGPVCPQTGSVPAFFTPANGIDEDCLTLNVWKPARRGASTPLPVMLWIHGGEFIRHGSGQNGWDGRTLAARENVVVVSINYRLGALSFLYDSADGIGGNLGLVDQQLAIKWVHDNIAEFGGDPDKVMLFGWSAGAASVAMHTLSIPSSRAPEALFRAVLTQSAPISVALKDTREADDRTYLAAQADDFRQAVCPGASAGADPSCMSPACVACADAACHADEHRFMWNTLPIVDTTPPIPNPLLPALDAAQQQLADAMQDFWGNFAKNLDPGTAAGLRWPSFAAQGDYQIFGCQGDGCAPILSTTTTVPYNDCEFWDTQIGYQGLRSG